MPCMILVFLLLFLTGYIAGTIWLFRFVTLRVADVELPVVHACLLLLLCNAISMILSPIIWILFDISIKATDYSQLYGDAATIPFTFPVAAFILGSAIKNQYPNTGKPIGFAKGAKIVAPMYGVRILLAVGLFFLIRSNGLAG